MSELQQRIEQALIAHSARAVEDGEFARCAAAATKAVAEFAKHWSSSVTQPIPSSMTNDVAAGWALGWEMGWEAALSALADAAMGQEGAQGE